MTEPPDRDWIGRVREADREAEAYFTYASNVSDTDPEHMTAHALIAIAAELRAQRIARRPGAGQ